MNTPLRTIRKARTLTQEQLADLVGIHQESISRAEKGKMILPRDVQVRLAAILGVGVDELFPKPEVNAFD